MALTDGDRALIKEMARELIKEVMIEHINTCPHWMYIRLLKAKFIGICIGSGLGGGGIVALAQKLFGG